MSSTKVKSKWINGNLVFQDKNGNPLIGLDGENRLVEIGGVAITATPAELNNLDLSTVGAISKVKKIQMSAADFPDNSEIATGWSLPADAVVKNVFIRVNTAEVTATTKTIIVGTDSTDGGDADGYLAGVSVAATGLVKGTLLHTGRTVGALLQTTGSATAAVPEANYTMGGKEITVSAGDAGGFDEADFDIFIEYIEIA